MSRNACAIVAFIACFALTHGVVDAQGGKKQFGGKKGAGFIPPGATPPDVKQDADARTKQGPTYMPLQVGNRWEYSLTQNGKSGTLISKIARIEVVSNIALAVLESEVDGKVTSTEILREIDLGVIRLRSGQLAPTPPFLILRSPAKGGDKWNAAFVVGKNKGTYVVETAEEEIDVPAGKFKTIQTAMTIRLGTGKPSTTKTWYAQNVGIVKQAVGDDVVAVLQDFSVPSAVAKAGDGIAASDAGQGGLAAGGLAAVGLAATKEVKSKYAIYYPIDVGNRWEYDFSVNGAVSANKLVMRIGRLETDTTLPLSVLETEVDGKIVATEHLRQTEQGVFRFRADNQVHSPALLIAKTPLKGGDKWGGTFTVGNKKKTYAAETSDEVVDVPAGKFKTVRVKSTLEEQGKKTTTILWFAENIGFVKQSLDGDGLKIVAELRSHELKQGPTEARRAFPEPRKGVPTEGSGLRKE